MSGFTARYTLNDILGRNSSLRRQIDLAATVAKRTSRVLVMGETGRARN